MKSCVMISGATGGLGKAFAAECASRGYDLFLTDLHPEPLEILATALRGAHGVQVRWHACDLRDADQRANLFQALNADRLRFWSLINVAGVDHEGLFRSQSREQIRTIVRLNIEAGIEMTHALLGLRDPAQKFRVINVASLAAFFPMPYKATYAASKRFLLDFSLALAAELRADGVTVTVLCPAGMPTTPETIAAIAAQGWLGQITTQNTGTVAAETLDAALRGRSICVPGVVNRVLRVLGGFLPPSLIAGAIGRRWEEARRERGIEHGELLADPAT